MPDEFVCLCAILLISIGAIFAFVGWFLFSFLRLNPKRTIETTGTLVCFREHLATTQFCNNYTDYGENRRGRVPVVTVEIDGETCEISAAAPDYSLTEADIGSAVRVCYQRKFGIVLLVHDEKLIRRYIRRKKTAFWRFLIMGLLFVKLGSLLLL